MHLQYLIRDPKSLVKAKLLRSLCPADHKQLVTAAHCSMQYGSYQGFLAKQEMYVYHSCQQVDSPTHSLQSKTTTTTHLNVWQCLPQSFIRLSLATSMSYALQFIIHAFFTQLLSSLLKPWNEYIKLYEFSMTAFINCTVTILYFCIVSNVQKVPLIMHAKDANYVSIAQQSFLYKHQRRKQPLVKAVSDHWYWYIFGLIFRRNLFFLLPTITSYLQKSQGWPLTTSFHHTNSDIKASWVKHHPRLRCHRYTLQLWKLCADDVNDA